jgi:hypothetical protein
MRYLHKRRRWMRYQAYRRQHWPIGSGITEAACKIVFTQRLKCSRMAWTREGGQVILDLRVISLSGVWDTEHQRYLASKPLPVLPGYMVGICLRWDSWNMTAVTSKMHGMPVTGGRGFRALKPL